MILILFIVFFLDFVSILFVVLVLFLFLRSRWRFVDVLLIFSCPADRVCSNWQPRTLITEYG